MDILSLLTGSFLRIPNVLLRSERSEDLEIRRKVRVARALAAFDCGSDGKQPRTDVLRTLNRRKGRTVL